MNKYLMLLILCLTGIQLYAQDKIVTGTVNAAMGPVSHASVFEKDIPGNGTVTDEKGNFRLVIHGKGILVIRSVGFLAQEADLKGKSQLAIMLLVDNKELDDVVVIGYGKKKKITNTAAVSAITGDELRQTPTASLQNALIGKVTGITSQQRSGQPGSDGANILVRGSVTLGNNTGAANPIILVDDIPFYGNLSDIDPEQIENMSILKDAGTTAIYGIQGANGAILITTKRGKTAKPVVTFRSETGGQAPTFYPKFVNSYESALLRNQALKNDGLPPLWADADLQAFKDHTDPYGHPDVDWSKTLLRPYSLVSTNTASVSGGMDKVKYFISGTYLWQNGMVKNFSGKELNSNYYFKRYNFRSNLDIQATKDLSLNVDFAGNFAERNEPNIHGRNDRNKILFEINDYVQLPPFAYNLYNPDGSYGANPFNGAYSNNVIGRFALGGYNRSFTNDITANVRAIQKLDFITKGLSVKGVLGYNASFLFYRSMTRTNFPAFAYNPSTKVYTPFNPNVYDIEKLALGYYNDAPNSFKNLNYQGSVNYDRNFSAHHVSALALVSQTTRTTGIGNPKVFRNYTFRAAYDYNQTYLLELSAGYSGTSQFPSEGRYALFPAVSLGWNVAKEAFFANTFTFFDVFKLRASQGLVGSDNLGTGSNYVYLPSYARVGTYSIGDVSRTINGIVESTLGTSVTWEKERETDYGVDIKMFHNKLSFTADYFRRYRYDILISRGSVSTILGAGVPPVNLGKVQNNGIELELGYNGTIKQLSYSVKGLIAVYKNKILYMDEAQPAYPWLSLTGHSVGSPTGYTFTGFYADSADVAASPKTPIAAKPGDTKYADINKDGKVDVSDQRVLDYPNLPNTFVGFNGTLNYKGFSLAFTMQAALNFAMRRGLTGNYTEQRLDAWTPTNNINPSLPRLTTIASVSDYDSDFWFRRMDYLRLKSVQIGYQLPRKWVKPISLNGVRVYASAYNLLTWMLKAKNIYDFDPEAPTSTEGGEYPVQKTVNVGLQITF